MARVMTTNAAKIAMFRAGEPTEVASAKGSVRAMGQFSFEAAASGGHLGGGGLGHRVELAVGPAGVDDRDREGRDELAEAEEQPHRDAGRADLLAHEARGRTSRAGRRGSTRRGRTRSSGRRTRGTSCAAPGTPKWTAVRGKRPRSACELRCSRVTSRVGVRTVLPGSTPSVGPRRGPWAPVRGRPRGGRVGGAMCGGSQRAERRAARDERRGSAAGRCRHRPGIPGMMGACARYGRSRQVPVSSSSTSPSRRAATRTSRSGCCGPGCAAPTCTSSSGTSGRPPPCRCR